MITKKQMVVGAYIMHHTAPHIQKIISLNKSNEAVLTNGMLVPVSELKLVEVGMKIRVGDLQSTFTVIGFDNWVTAKKEDVLFVEQNNQYRRVYRICNFKTKCYPLDQKEATNAE